MQFLRERVLKARRHSLKRRRWLRAVSREAVHQSSELPVSGSNQTEHDNNLMFKALSDATSATSAREAAGKIPAPKRNQGTVSQGLV